MKQVRRFKKLTALLLTLALMIGLAPAWGGVSYAVDNFNGVPLGGDVYAAYDGTTITISGHGQIERDKWDSMVAPFYDEFDEEWSGPAAFVFSSTSTTEQIKLPPDCSYLFYWYNGNINFGSDGVDTSSVTNMSYMFYNVSSFNQPLNNWDVSHVTDMSYMFRYANSFNQPLDDWNVSHVTDMSSMFGGAQMFNQPLDNWDVSQVTDMSYMFNQAKAFNQPLDMWDTVNVARMDNMFSGASNYAEAISFNASSLKDIGGAFEGTQIPSIQLFNFAGAMDIETDDGADQYPNTLNYLEFSGLQPHSIQESAFTADYYVQNISDGSAPVLKQQDQAFEFEANKHYKLYLDGPKNIKACDIIPNVIALQAYQGSAVEPDIVIKDGTNELNAGTDYELTYHDNNAAGRAYIEISGKNGYTDTRRIYFDISAKKVVTLTADNLTKVYNGKPITLDDINNKTASDGGSAVAGEWQFVTDVSKCIEPNGYPVRLKFIPVNTTEYDISTIDIVLTIEPNTFNNVAISTDNGVKASYDGNQLTITGTGTIDYQLWIKMAQKINADYYASDDDAWLMHEDDKFKIVFNGDSAESILLCGTGEQGGLFAGFSNEIMFDQPVDIAKSATNLSAMFTNTKVFNQPLNNWDVSHVTDMSEMFYRAAVFNQPLDNWNVSHVTDMSSMFTNANVFNQPLNSWNVSHVTDMSRMFESADVFNQPLNNWDVSHVTDMSSMFTNANVFNQPLNSWNVSAVTNMSSMFTNAYVFNQSLDNWNVSKYV